jgi:hypothetical protein
MYSEVSMNKKEDEELKEKVVQHIRERADALNNALTKEEVYKLASELTALWDNPDWCSAVRTMATRKLTDLDDSVWGIAIKKGAQKTYGARIQMAASDNLLGILGTVIGAGVTAAFFGGGHLGLSIGGNGYDMGPAWMWGGAAGGVVGHAGDHIRKSRRVK